MTKKLKSFVRLEQSFHNAAIDIVKHIVIDNDLKLQESTNFNKKIPNKVVS
jgi:hypothetical protein